MSPVSSLAFFGPEGSWSHQAALRVPAAHREPRRSIGQVFEAVRDGACEAGVVPGENVLEGPVNETLDQLLRTSLVVSGEIVLPIEHCLVGRPGAHIERVYSHPQALAQCRAWLDEHLPGAQRVESASTAEGVVVALGDPGGAAIASGARAGLEILERNLSPAGNHTRFFIVTKALAPASGHDRALVSFRAPHRPGALHLCLEPFATAGINLLRLEHRPAESRDWTYDFVAEVEGHPASPGLAAALEALRRCATEVRILGAWRTAAFDGFARQFQNLSSAAARPSPSRGRGSTSDNRLAVIEVKPLP